MKLSDIDRDVDSQVVGRGEDRLTVRLVHLADSGWRWVEFEGSRGTVEAVVDKVRHPGFLNVRTVVFLFFKQAFRPAF